MKSIVEAVSQNAELYPQKICIVDRKGEYNYQTIWESIQRVAQIYIDLGIQKNNCVIIECTQGADYIISGLACQLIGAIMIPVEYKIPEANLNDIIRETDAQLLLCKTNFKTNIESIYFKKLLEKANTTQGLVKEFPKKEDSAEILYTAGTTGKSKGIELTNINNICLAENIIFGTEMKKYNVELIPLPLSHSHGLRTCYANLYNGSTVILVEGMTQVKFIFDLILKYKVTALDLTPSTVLILKKFFGKKIHEFNRQIDYIQIGTAMLPEKTKEMLIEDFPKARLYNFYGSTESGRTCVLDFSKYRNKKGCIGIPSYNARFVITDDNRNIIQSSKQNPGLLACAGKMNMKAYWRNPELTKEVLQGEFIYTNDLGYIDEDGFIYILGRKDDVINCGGIKIAPTEIEEYVIKCLGIRDCACVPIPDKILGQVPKLYIVVDDINKFKIQNFMAELKIYISNNKLPKEIEIIDQIPRTHNGKIQRMKLVDKERKDEEV